MLRITIFNLVFVIIFIFVVIKMILTTIKKDETRRNNHQNQNITNPKEDLEKHLTDKTPNIIRKETICSQCESSNHIINVYCYKCGKKLE